MAEKRSPSRPGLGSSVTSCRSWRKGCSALAILAPVPWGPPQISSARTAPGATGWSAQSMPTWVPKTCASAHSTCGLTARGQEWMKITPRAGPMEGPASDAPLAFTTIVTAASFEIRLPQRSR